MEVTVRTLELTAPPLDRDEVLRYAGCRAGYATDLPEKCMAEVAEELRYSVCWAEVPVRPTDGGVDIGFTEIRSQYALRRLLGFDRAIVFAATVGLAPDRMVERYGRLSPARSLMHQALGTERIESLCDSFCKGMGLAARFSPGYGDIPLSLQTQLFQALDITKNIGVTLTDSLLMVPTKSVTAIAGIGSGAGSGCGGGCADCSSDCAFRKN